MSAPIIVLLLVMLVYPVGQLLLLSVHNGSGFTLVEYKRLFASSVYVDVLLITLKVVAVSPAALSSSLKIRLAAVEAGKVKSAIPVRVVAVSWVVTPLARATL